MPRNDPLTWDRVLAWRMSRSFLTSPGDGLVQVAERLGGVQAQLMSSAETALSLRVGGAGPGEVRTALWESRSLVKTWTVRGTLHLISPADFPVFVAAMGARGEFWASAAWERYHGVSAKEMRSILGAIDEALSGRCLTRMELAERLGGLTGMKELADRIMGSWGSIIKPAAFQGSLCFGPNRGRNITFVSPADWLGGWEPVEEDEALATLTRRYLETYGPSTKDDLARWLGVEPKVARRALELVKDELVPLTIGDSSRWCTGFGAEELRAYSPEGVVRLLQAFDPYVVGVLKHLDQLVPTPDLRSRVSKTAGWIAPVILRDGRILGTWETARKGKQVEISVELFEDVKPKVAKAIGEQVEITMSLLGSVSAVEDS